MLAQQTCVPLKTNTIRSASSEQISSSRQFRDWRLARSRPKNGPTCHIHVGSAHARLIRIAYETAIHPSERLGIFSRHNIDSRADVVSKRTLNCDELSLQCEFIDRRCRR